MGGNGNRNGKCYVNLIFILFLLFLNIMWIMTPQGSSIYYTLAIFIIITLLLALTFLCLTSRRQLQCYACYQFGCRHNRHHHPRQQQEQSCTTAAHQTDNNCEDIVEICEFESFERQSSKFQLSAPTDESNASMTSYSTNWCGYIAGKSLTNPVTGSCTYVSGSFKVPTIYSDVQNPNNNVSIWTGIDGAFATDQTVQQIGIDGSYSNGRVSWYAWFEMYPSGAYKINGFPIQTGDVMTCSVRLISKGTYQLIMKNETRHVQVVVPTNYTRNSGAKLQSLEWIVEAPWMRTTLPLTHFSPVMFFNCIATIGGITGAINKFQNDNFNMIVPNSIGPQYKAQASSPPVNSNNGSSFTVTWSHI